MKKTYINPEMEAVEEDIQQLLAASPTLNGEYQGGTVLGRDSDEDFDEE